MKFKEATIRREVIAATNSERGNDLGAPRIDDSLESLADVSVSFSVSDHGMGSVAVAARDRLVISEIT